ncbi:pre-RNA processing PIH1/Nop17-domain-containing protein [Gorgonomyces haynaldii]|nr:pre-RNA processing PIH1/Nop17-domain-containing protein [Gorgonomyces haynaldii]
MNLLINKDLQDTVKEEAYKNDPGLEQLVQQFATQLAVQQKQQEDDSMVQPQSGFVVKTKLVQKSGDYPKDMKVFVNLCHSPEIPAPPMLSKQEIQIAIAAEDNSQYRLPLSLTPPKSDMDKSGSVCVVFDACINSRPFQESTADDDFKLFVVELALQWVEQKHDLKLSRQISFPKMRSKGYLAPHKILRKKRADIVELEKTGPSKPKYTITKEPEDKPEFVVFQVELPLLVLDVRLGEHRRHDFGS